MEVWNLKRVPVFVKHELIKFIDGDKEIRADVVKGMKQHWKEIEKTWPKELAELAEELVKVNS